MKLKISFEIEYDDPLNDADYQELLAEIKSFYGGDEIPQTEEIWWKSQSDIQIERQ